MLDKEIEQYVDKEIHEVTEEIDGVMREVGLIKKQLEFIVNELIKKGLGNL